MALGSETSTVVDGKWNVTWRPGMSPPESTVLALSTYGGSLMVDLESDAGVGAGSAEGTVEGNTLSWTVTPDGSPGPIRFLAVVEGDELSGRVEMDWNPMSSPASLEGTRVGSSARVGSREGSDAILESLSACGVEYIFGYIGGMTASLQRSIVSHGMPNMAGRTELSAAWMSYGYNRVKRRAASGALMWTVGALHASPVVHAAKLDSTPLLLMTMESAAAWDMRDILQDGTDLYSVYKPLAKYIRRIVDGEDLPLAVRQAVLAASTGKFGPAVLNLTHEAMFQRTTVKSETLVLPSPPAAAEQRVTEVLQMITEASKPVILAGAGVHMADAGPELREFVEATGIPVVTSGPGGRGVLPDDHPLYAGDMSSWGYFGTGTELAEQADLWIAVGFSFSQTATLSWTLSKPEKVIHVDIEEAQLGRIFQPSMSIVADAKVFLGQLNRQVEASGAQRPDYAGSSRVAEIEKAKAAYFEYLGSFTGDPIMPAAIGQALAEEVPAGTLLVQDEGFMVPGMVYRGDKYPSGFATALGFHYASLGSTLPVAIGAKLAEPERLVISVGGDGGFFYNCGDLSILAEHNLKMVSILVNNGGLFGGRRGRAHGGGGSVPTTHWSDYPEIDYTAIATGLGVQAERVEKMDHLAPAIRRAIAADGPYFIEVQAAASSMHLQLMARPPEAPDGHPRKFGHGDRVVKGSWPR